MLSFRQFLTEKFVIGTTSPRGYCEVFRNPTPDEFVTAGERGSNPHIPGVEALGRCIYLGGIITDKNLYVFNRGQAQHSQVNYQAVPAAEQMQGLYCYLYYFPKTNVLCIDPSAFAQVSEYDIQRRVSKHPVMRRFAKVINDGGKILTEKFLMGTEGKYGGYAEIYINPTPDELLTIGNRHTPVNVALQYLGRDFVSFGAIAAGNTLYAFDREHAEHSDVANTLGDKLPHNKWLPLDMYYWPKHKTGAVLISQFSLSNMMGHATQPTNAQYGWLASHPVLKRLFKVFLRTGGTPV